MEPAGDRNRDRVEGLSLLFQGQGCVLRGEQFEEALRRVTADPTNGVLYKPFLFHFYSEPFHETEAEMALFRFLIDVARSRPAVNVLAPVCQCLSFMIGRGTPRNVRASIAKVILEVFCEYLTSDSSEVLGLVLFLISRVTSNVPECASSVFCYLDPGLLATITAQSTVVTIQRSGMLIFGSFIHAESLEHHCLTPEFLCAYLNLCKDVFQAGNSYAKLEGLKSLSVITRNWRELHAPIVSHESGMVTFLNTFLSDSDDQLFSAAADVLEMLLTSDCGIGNDIDIPGALPHMTSSVDTVSVAATSLVARYVNTFRESVIVLAELGLIEQTMEVISHGTHKAKLHAVCILNSLVLLDSSEGLALRLRCTTPEILFPLLELMQSVQPVLLGLVIGILRVFIAVDEASGMQIGIIEALKEDHAQAILLSLTEGAGGEAVEVLLSSLD